LSFIRNKEWAFRQFRPGAHWDAGERRAGQIRAGIRSTGNTAWHSV